MPQTFPMNWMLLSFLIIIIFFSPEKSILSNKNFMSKKNNLNFKSMKWNW